MRHIDEDTITQAVIARHAAAADPRLRELMTSLVQHLHAFAREVQLTEAEWAGGLRFLGECARAGGSNADARHELALLSDTLGLSALVAAFDRRRARGSTERAMPAAFHLDGAACATPVDGDSGFEGESCFVRGRVRSADDNAPIAGAEVRVWPSGVQGEGGAVVVCRSDGEGGFVARCALAQAHTIPHDGPVGRLLESLGRHAWRPAHLHVMITASGYERLLTHVFRQGGRYLDSDAVFGVRGSLVAEWVQHASGRTPDGRMSREPFTTLDFAFVLNPARGDKP